jgi:5-methylcytosine-specific restriction protein A
LLFDGPRIPLAVGRTSRTATPAQRKALATRDGGCIIPGCQIPAENCQAHHVTDWAAGGESDIDNLALLCWTHHRQVDLDMWTITPTEPGRLVTQPPPGAPPETPWPANNRAPWTITRTQRTRWRP